MFIFKREGFFLSRVREAGGILYGDSSVMYLCKFLHSMSVGYKRFQHAFHPINIYHMELERNCKRGKKCKKKKMKRWGLCWKSRREWTVSLSCSGEPVPCNYCVRSERDEPATARWLQTSGGRTIPHGLLTHMVRHYPKQIGLSIMVSIRKPNTRRSSKDHNGWCCFIWASPTSSANNKNLQLRFILINIFPDQMWTVTEVLNILSRITQRELSQSLGFSKISTYSI